ncbi:hypothetical protein A4R26_28040 [Niastella populi]|uniref:Uncharacterized protein n=1 Tax=Niastella populi TaxID=550983 RepID=A0A1V9F813_9BACT|nr:hypothetical protein A4R26_28040 [Niastella populi]
MAILFIIITSSFNKKSHFIFHKVTGPPRSTNPNDYYYAPYGSCTAAVNITCAAYWSQNTIPNLYAHPDITAKFQSIATDGEYIDE